MLTIFVKTFYSDFLSCMITWSRVGGIVVRLSRIKVICGFCDIWRLGFNIEVQQVMVCRILDAESGNPTSCAVASSTAAELAALLHP